MAEDNKKPPRSGFVSRLIPNLPKTNSATEPAPPAGFGVRGIGIGESVPAESSAPSEPTAFGPSAPKAPIRDPLDVETVLTNPDLSRYDYRAAPPPDHARDIEQVRSGKVLPKGGGGREKAEKTVSEPKPSGQTAERPGTKTLDYIALGLLLAPPAVVVEMYLKSEPISWRRTAIATAVCWLGGGLALLAAHGWQSWRSKEWRVLPYLIAAEKTFWGKAIIVGVSIGVALALSSVLSNSPSLAPTPPSGSFGFAPLKPPEPHIGETFSIELAQVLSTLPKPCLVKITNPSNTELGGLINWVATYGDIPSGTICKSQPDNVLRDADKKYAQPTTEPGMVIHWNASYAGGEKIAHFLDASGVRVRISHQLDADAPDNLIWFDIGPGSPWKQP